MEKKIPNCPVCGEPAEWEQFKEIWFCGRHPCLVIVQETGDDLEKLKNIRQANDAEIKRLTDSNKELVARIIKLEFGIAVGDTVVGNYGKKFVITRIREGYHSSKPYVQGRLIKKDGTQSEQQRDLWNNWELAQNHSSAQKMEEK